MRNESFANIFDAAKSGSIENVKFFVEELGADVDVTDEHGNTPLDIAAKFNSELDVLEYIFSVSAVAKTGKYPVAQDVDGRAKAGCTCSLFRVIQDSSNVALLKYLVAVGADVNPRLVNKSGSQAVDGWTPLHFAVWKSNMEVLKCLISLGADVHQKDENGRTPLIVAAQMGNIEVIQFLISKGADIHTKNNEGRTSLHFAAANDNLEVVEFLVSLGADVHAKNVLGHAPLVSAICNSKNTAIVFFLISQGSDVSAKDTTDWTPLHQAAYSNDNVEVARFLVSKGADVHAKTQEGETPLDFAKTRENTAVAEYLETIIAEPQS